MILLLIRKQISPNHNNPVVEILIMEASRLFDCSTLDILTRYTSLASFTWKGNRNLHNFCCDVGLNPLISVWAHSPLSLVSLRWSVDVRCWLFGEMWWWCVVTVVVTWSSPPPPPLITSQGANLTRTIIKHTVLNSYTKKLRVYVSTPP